MTNMTMGQRIAAQRKLAGLSQEALSEQLDVSRQAISKWESDGAIPEIDKLIALGRIFGVSVGWLLGTETECRYDPDAGLNETQSKMVEEIAARYQPKQTPLWKRALATICVLALLGGVALHYQTRIDRLSADNVTTQTQLAQLSQANEELQTQLDQVTAMLEKQEAEGKLVREYGLSGGYASDDMKEVTIDFYLTPKFYQESTDAYLSVTNPRGYSETLDCAWNGVQYIVQVTCPLEDNTHFRFILAGEDSYQEELLNDRDPDLSLLKTHAAFSIDPADPKYDQMRFGETTRWPISNTVYTYNSPLFPPFTLPELPMAYQDIVFTLYRNDEPIWQESWKAEFLSAYGNPRIYADPVAPDISVELPALAVGDRLRLEITAELTGGQILTTILDDLTVTG